MTIFASGIRFARYELGIMDYDLELCPEVSLSCKLEKILVVDDEQAVGAIIEALLNHWGFSACVAHSRLSCLQVWEREKEHIATMIIDLHLGQDNGFELARRFRAEKPDLKIILATGSISDETLNAAYVQGFYYLPKPFKAERLRELVS